MERLADWLEASVLFDGLDVSKSELMEELQANGLVLPTDASFGEDVDEVGSDSDEAFDDALERVADDVVAECMRRATRFGPGYPFAPDSDVVSLRTDVPHDSYAFLLIADLGHHYPALKNALTPDTLSGRLLEKVVEAAAKGIFGHSQRFGWPREPGWPTDIDGRIAKLAESLGLEVDSLDGKTDSADNDRTLDVVGMLRLEDPYEASLSILIQCAAGANWKDKLGEPSIKAWDNLLLWNASLVRAIALPWRLGGRKSDWTYRRIFALSDGAMVLDRPRLLAGRPDAHLDPSVRSDVSDWWRKAIVLIPVAQLRRAASTT